MFSFDCSSSSEQQQRGERTTEHETDGEQWAHVQGQPAERREKPAQTRVRGRSRKAVRRVRVLRKPSCCTGFFSWSASLQSSRLQCEKSAGTPTNTKRTNLDLTVVLQFTPVSDAHACERCVVKEAQWVPLGSYMVMVEGVGTIGSLDLLLARHTRRWLPPSSISTRYKFTYNTRRTYERPIGA